MSLTSEQAHAFNLAASEALTVVQAPPGCGKSHLIRALVETFSDPYRVAVDSLAPKPLKTLVTARNLAIVEDMCKRFDIVPKDGIDASGRIQVLNFDKITARALDPRGRKLSGVFYKLGSDNRDTKFLAKSLGIDTVEIGNIRLSQQRLAGMVETSYQRFCRSGDDVPSWHHVAQIVEGEDAASVDRSIRESVADRVAMLTKMIDRAAESCGNEHRFPLVSKSTKFATVSRWWAKFGFRVDADVVLIDEAQDLDKLFLRAIETWVAQGKKVVLCGDRFQELYAWAGAKNAMAYAVDKLGASTATLTQSHRFGPAIASIASEMIAPLAGPDSVIGLADDCNEMFGDIDAFLTHTNASVISTALALVESGSNVQIPETLAKEIKSLVKDIADLTDGKRAEGPLAYYASMAHLTKALMEDERLADVARVVQLVESHGANALLSLAESSGKRTFADGVPVVSTFHRVKGCEWDNVRVDVPTRKVDPETGKIREWSDVERMMLYVALTRAKRCLQVIGEL